GVDGLRGLDHLVERRGDRFGLVLDLALEDREQTKVAHRVAGEREFGGAAGGEIFDAVLILGQRQQLYDASDRLIGAGREIAAPQHVDQLRAWLDRHN